MIDSGREAPLEDFPLRGESEAGVAFPPSSPAAPGKLSRAADAPVAPLAMRISAAAADAAVILMISALAILAARRLTGASPRLAGIPWILAFLLQLSFFAIVPPLVLFGRTMGMALADLSADSGGGRTGLSGRTAFRRWLGTLATAATAGLALLWTARSVEAPTPADRLSGRSLTLD